MIDKFFQVPLKTSVVGGLVSFTIVIRIVVFRSGECKVVLDLLRASYLRLVLDDSEDVVDREPQRSEVFFHFENLEWIRRDSQECLLLEGELPPILVTSIGQSLVMRIYLFSVVVALERVVDRTIHSLLQLNIRLGLG